MLKPIPDETKVFRKVAIFKQMQLLKVRKVVFMIVDFRKTKTSRFSQFYHSLWICKLPDDKILTYGLNLHGFILTTIKTY